MREALDARHMGRVIRAFRLHPHHGRHIIPQQTAASWVGMTQAQLSRVETGSAPVHLDRLVQWAETLRIPSLYLWFQLPERGIVRRSEFLQKSGLVVAGAATMAVLGTRKPVSAITEDKCAQWLAWEMWTTRATEIHETALPREIAQFLSTYAVRFPVGRVILRDARGFYSFAHSSFVDFYVAQRVFDGVENGDSALFAATQTSHDTDLVLREFVLRNGASASTLTRWMTRAPNAVLRVNSAGVLAKLGTPDIADQVVRSLKGHADTRHLYLTAVASRVLALPWGEAGNLVAVTSRGLGQLTDHLSPDRAALFASKLSAEVHNPRDGGARWCAVVLLAQLANAAPTLSAAALHAALKEEQSAENLRSIGAALAGDNPLTI